MQTFYIILLALLILIMVIELSCIFGHIRIFYMYKDKIKPVSDFICTLLLCTISVVGCIETINLNIYFLVIYISIYFLLKEVYSTLITNRREKSIKIKLQSYVETKIIFNDLFLYETSIKEKEKTTTWWIRKYKNSDDKESIGILLNDQRHYFVLKREEYSESIDYIINQIYECAKEIKTKDDLNNLELLVITDNNLAKDYANNFIPHNKIKNIKNPIVYNDTMFNLTMVSGYIAGNALINMINAWNSLSIIEKIFNITFGSLFAISFISGLISLSIIIYESLKKTKWWINYLEYFIIVK